MLHAVGTWSRFSECWAAGGSQAAALAPEDGSGADELVVNLTKHFRERLRIFAARRLADASEAEAVAQETLRCAVEALRAGRVGDLSALPAFLFQTATHICLHRRRSVRRAFRALSSFAGETAGQRDFVKYDALTALVKTERRAEVRAALDRLSAEDREVLRLAFDEELDAAAIGLRLAASPSAARVRKHRALRRLGALIGGVTKRSVS